MSVLFLIPKQWALEEFLGISLNYLWHKPSRSGLAKALPRGRQGRNVTQILLVSLGNRIKLILHHPEFQSKPFQISATP